MKRHLIHTIEVKKPGAKLQFQIKLPRTVNKITGIQLAIAPKIDPNQGTTNPPHEGEIPPNEQPIIREPERGSLRLRIPERRDVFYSENVHFPSHALNGYWDFNEPGLVKMNEWWFSGMRQKYYTVDVPIRDTMIEGYYEDHSTDSEVDYVLKIYFKLNDYAE